MTASNPSGITALQVFGQEVRARRKELGLSQQQVAEKAGIDRTYVGDVERGAGNISLTKLLVLAAALDIPPSNLFLKLDQQPELYPLPE